MTASATVLKQGPGLIGILGEYRMSSQQGRAVDELEFHRQAMTMVCSAMPGCQRAALMIGECLAVVLHLQSVFRLSNFLHSILLKELWLREDSANSTV